MGRHACSNPSRSRSIRFSDHRSEPGDGIPAELLCDQCPWDAPVRTRRDDLVSPNATTTVTAEELRNLGVISLADPIDELPNETVDEPEDVSGSEDQPESNDGAADAGQAEE